MGLSEETFQNPALVCVATKNMRGHFDKSKWFTLVFTAKKFPSHPAPGQCVVWMLPHTPAVAAFH